MHRRSRALMLLSVLPAALALPAAGCYERVVRAEGWGADQYRVEDPDVLTEREIRERKEREKTTQGQPVSRPRRSPY